MNTVASDIFVAVIGAVVGSLLTVSIGLVTFRLERRRNETQSLRGLVMELNARRALAPIRELRYVHNAAELDDYDRVNRSILDVRERVKRTGEAVRADSEIQLTLSKMTRACNRYLEASAREPNHFWYALMELRKALSEGVHTIAATSKSIEPLEPGDRAFD